MPGAFPATPYGANKSTLPTSNGSFTTHDRYLEDYVTTDWNGSPIQPVVGIKAEEDEVDFYF
jgi:hypothetical protein